MKTIEQLVDAMCPPEAGGNKQPRPKHHFRRTKLGIKVSPVTAILIAGMLVTGSLLGFIWVNYSITIDGEIEVSGGMGEAVMLYYDNALLTGSGMTITTMDISSISAGETLRFPHTVSNLKMISGN